jgi:hypothetical protein
MLNYYWLVTRGDRRTPRCTSETLWRLGYFGNGAPSWNNSEAVFTSLNRKIREKALGKREAGGRRIVRRLKAIADAVKRVVKGQLGRKSLDTT